MKGVKWSKIWTLGSAGSLLSLGLAACGSTAPVANHQGLPGKPYAGETITVAFMDPIPAVDLKQFTKQTGIHVNFEDISWGSLQTKIVAAMTSHTYFADVTDVDWSRVGEYYALHWFHPLNKYFPVKQLSQESPIMSSFIDHGQLVGMPVDSSFDVTTVNVKDFAKAGITTMPTTLSGYTKDLKKLQSSGVMAHPLDIPFAAAEGLSTYWYQTTAAFGGTLLSKNFRPLFSKPSSAGYKAMEWMVNAYKTGLVPPANANMIDQQGMEQEMALNKVASVFGDYSGQVGTIYNVPSLSKVVGQVKYIPTPGVNGIGPNIANPDGMGIPVTAKHVGAAVAFIKWFDSRQNQAKWAGLNGTKYLVPNYPDPMLLSSFNMLVKAKGVPDGSMLLNLLKNHSRPVFPQGAPPWYPQWSSAVYTNIHAAALGQETVATAIKNIVNEVNNLRTSN